MKSESAQFKLIFTVPIVTQGDIVKDFLSSKYDTKIETDLPECKKVVYLTVPEDFSAKLASADLGSLITTEEDVTSIDLQGWLEPNHTLKMDVDLPHFMTQVVSDGHLPLLKSGCGPEEFKKLPKSYSYLATLASFLEFIKFDQESITALSSHIKKVYPPCLVLMNINGLLIHRTSERVNFVKSGDDSDKYRKQVDMFKHKQNFVYKREGHLEFLRSLMSHPRVKFAFYSTIMRQNIMPIITKIFEPDMLLLQEHMSALFDQEYNRAAPDITGEKWGFIRDLPKVWAAEVFKGEECSYGQANTLMLETDEINVYDCYQSSLIVDRYHREDVWPEDPKEARDQITILREVKQDIFRVLDQAEDNLPDFLERCSEGPQSPINFCDYVRKAKKLAPLGVSVKKEEAKTQNEVDDLESKMAELKV